MKARTTLKAGIAGCIVVVVLAGVALAAVRSESPSGVRSFPNRISEPRKAGPGLVQFGRGSIAPFRWSIYAQGGHPVCFAVYVDGPLQEFPGHTFGGPETSETKCALNAAQQRVVAVPMRDGDSEQLPWPAFDVGIVAFDRPVNRVRLIVFGGGSTELQTRRVGVNFGVSGLSSLRYAVFAVEGCVSRVEGLEGGRVVATVTDRSCRYLK